MFADKPFFMNSFHGVSSRKPRPGSLKLKFGKARGLVPAVASVFPKRPHQFCQAHYLRNLATPLADADTAFKSEVRKSVRDQVGSLIRQEAMAGDGPNGVLTVTGILPELSADPPLPPSAASEGLGRERSDTAKADELVNHLLAHTRYLLTLKGRPPFRLAGLELYERLQRIVGLSFDLLTHRLDLRLAKLYQGLKEALAPFAQTYAELQQGAVWLRDIADILALSAEPGWRVQNKLRVT